MLQRILLFVIVPLGLLTLLGYYWLGGFNSMTIEVVQQPARPVVGKHYQGRYGDLALSKIFVQARQLQEGGTLPGLLTVVNLDRTSASEQSVNQFIGITLAAPPETVPEGYQVDTLPAGAYLRGILPANSLVMPPPKAVNQQLLDYAREHQLSVSGLSIEFYQASDTLWIEMAVQP